MKGVYLLLGSNLGNSMEILMSARDMIKEQVGTIVNCSSIYKTKAWGIEDQPDFLNQVIEIDTDFNPDEVLAKILKIEQDLGRIRYQKWGTRIIDIDILYFGDQVLDSERLVIPHPENQNRNFVLVPIAEIAGDFIHPILKLSQKELLLSCQDKLLVEKLNDDPF